mgnify:CR=1 FL=1
MSRRPDSSVVGISNLPLGILNPTECQQFALRMMDLTQSVPLVDWLTVDRDKLEGVVARVPERSDIDPLVNEQLIVELYSR